jgi:hypothetical protein
MWRMYLAYFVLTMNPLIITDLSHQQPTLTMNYCAKKRHMEDAFSPTILC